MALKALMLKKQLDNKRKALEDLQKRSADFERREAELEAAIAEVENDEQRAAVDESIDEFEKDKAAHDKAVGDLNEEIRGLEKELEELEEAQEAPAPAEAASTETEERKEHITMETRKFFKMSAQERDAFFAREDVKTFLEQVRTGIREKRAIQNAGLLIPTVMLGLLRENIMEYSKLYKHVNVRPISGEGKLAVMGTIPEAVWTDCCANLNELSLAFNDVEVDCWKVGGYFAVCNATLEDSDIDLASDLLVALGQAIGLALDKAILYGTGSRMPLGVVSRLCQTSQPADYPPTARPWVDLHTKNVKTINSAGMTPAQLFAAIVEDFGAAKGKYSRGEKVFVMNETTYTTLAAQTVSVDASGRIVTAIFDRMPVTGGIIEVLDFVPDNVIIGGYFDLYLLAERSGNKFATSEHVKFLADQTVMKGTARYDGKPAIAEGFVAIGIKNTTPNADMTFAPDDANPDESE